jgi:hypothetical protein
VQARIDTIFDAALCEFAFQTLRDENRSLVDAEQAVENARDATSRNTARISVSPSEASWIPRCSGATCDHTSSPQATRDALAAATTTLADLRDEISSKKALLREIVQVQSRNDAVVLLAKLDSSHKEAVRSHA